MFEKWKGRSLPDGAEIHQPTVVLAITTSRSDRETLERVLLPPAFDLLIAPDLEEAARVLDSRPVAIVICDRDLSGADWREAIHQIARHQCSAILASFVADDYLWEEVIHQGGYDVLPKPFREDEVLHTIRFARTAFMRSRPSAPRTE